MTDIFGATRSDLRERIGSLAQVVRVDSFVEAEGMSRGARRIRLVNGGGIELEVHPDRALDIGRLTIDGIPVSWIWANGITAPQFYEPGGNGWLRTFGGGLLATCGLDTFGPPSEDGGQLLGQHGRIGALSAQIVRSEATEDEVVVEGVIRQANLFEENLVLRRRISSAAGSDTVLVEDTVTNEGFVAAPHMILYHCNLGWPLLDCDSRVEISSTSIEPRDTNAASGLNDWGRVGLPVPGFREQVFRHGFGDRGPATARIVNPVLGLEFTLTFPSDVLPTLYQWKMIGQGAYVVGLEPSNCSNVFGRAAARAAGELPLLQPGQSVNYRLEFRLRRLDTATAAGSERNAV